MSRLVTINNKDKVKADWPWRNDLQRADHRAPYLLDIHTVRCTLEFSPG